MTGREQRQARVLSRILMGALTMAEGSTELGVSERQLWRLRGAFVAGGPAGLVHGNRGRPSPRRIEPDRRVRILELRERFGFDTVQSRLQQASETVDVRSHRGGSGSR